MDTTTCTECAETEYEEWAGLYVTGVINVCDKAGSHEGPKVARRRKSKRIVTGGTPMLRPGVS